MKIAQLVRPVVMTLSQNVVGGEKPNSRGRRGVARFFLGIVAKQRHLPLVLWPIRWKQVRKHAKSGVTDRFSLVRAGALRFRTPGGMPQGWGWQRCRTVHTRQTSLCA